MPSTVTPERVLTILQPWIGLILSGRKTVEFRSWPVPWRAIDVDVALHFAKTGSAGDERAGHIVAVATLREACTWRIDVPEESRCQRCIEQERLIQEHNPGWFIGTAFRWHLDNVRLVKPMPYKGAQGLLYYTGAPLELLDTEAQDGR